MTVSGPMTTIRMSVTLFLTFCIISTTLINAQTGYGFKTSIDDKLKDISRSDENAEKVSLQWSYNREKISRKLKESWEKASTELNSNIKILSRDKRDVMKNVIPPKWYTVNATEHTELNISCTHSLVINVLSATYEPENLEAKEKCAINCTRNGGHCKALDVVAKECGYQPNCTFIANNTLFGDPCIHQRKHLTVNYTCVSPNDTRTGDVIQPTGQLEISNDTSEFRTSAPSRHAISLNTGGNGGKKGMTDLTDAKISQVKQLQLILAQSESSQNVTWDLTLDLLTKLLVTAEDLENRTATRSEDVEVISDMLYRAVTNLLSTRYMGQEKSVNQTQRVNYLVTSVASAMLNPQATRAWESLPVELRVQKAATLLKAVEESAFLLANSLPVTSSQITAVHDNIVLQINVIASSDLSLQTDITFSPPLRSNSPASHDDNDDNDEMTGSRSYIRLSTEDLKQAATADAARIVFIRYKNLFKWLPKTLPDEDLSNASATLTTTPTTTTNPTTVSESQSGTTMVDQNFILSASVIGRSERLKLTEPVEFQLRHSPPLDVNNTNTTCVYWNFTRSIYGGSWQEDGCWVKNRTPNHTICQCDHLTNFAVLMSTTNHTIPDVHRLTLSVITYIGCTLSCVCLLLAFITFHSYSTLQNDRNTIHKNLTMCLLLAELVFMCGITQYEYKNACIAIAVLLHYLFLTAFSWMCLEGVQLYVLLVEVFESERSRTLWYYLAAYGTPALIVLTTVLVNNGGGYGTEDYCWLKVARGFVWAFVGPVILILIVNLIMLSITLHIMCKHAGNNMTWKAKSSTTIETIGSWVKGAFVLMVLLGSTWVLGLFYVDQHSLFMAYLFTISNTLQGAFIFIFHCLLNEKVRNEYRKTLQNSAWIPNIMREKFNATTTSNVQTSTSNSNSTANRFIKMLRNKGQVKNSSFLKNSGSANNRGKEPTSRCKSWIHTAFTRVRTEESHETCQPTLSESDHSGYTELSRTNSGDEEFLEALEQLQNTARVEP